VLDASGARLMSFGASRSINSEPSWSPDGRRIFFSSERNGMPQIYVADISAAPVRIARLTDAATGVFSPEVSPSQTKLASVLFLADGDHIGVAPIPEPLSFADSDSVRVAFRAGCADCIASPPAGLAPLGVSDTSKATPYSPWASLLPRYWTPVFEGTTLDGTSWGAATSGYDIVARHDYTLEVLHNNKFGQNSAWLWYRYAGFGLPLIDLYASQNYSNGNFGVATTSPTTIALGRFSERDRVAALSATFIRPRFRSYSLLSIGGELESFSYLISPDTLLQYLSTYYEKTHTLPAIVGTAGWSNAQRPGLSISPEDGVSTSLTVWQRWEQGTSGLATRSVVGVSSLYKSLDLPGFAHHVLAFRAAGGTTDERSVDLFSAGGISGTSLEVFPGFALGQQRRIFGVRGYPASAEEGIRAYAATVEYRAPLFAPSRGFRFIPVFIDKTSLTFFGETGRAYCPANAAASSKGVCYQSAVGNPAMTSVGAELNVDTGLQLDLPARFRLGVAFPLANREELRATGAQIYSSFGASF
jgi:hypothetical protein